MEETSSKKNPLIYFTGVLILSAVVTFFLIDKCSSSKNTAKQDDRSKISENLDSMRSARKHGGRRRGNWRYTGGTDRQDP